jgi:uncharacterized SAM-binding protein YcdF (DUF218 family)
VIGCAIPALGRRARWAGGALALTALGLSFALWGGNLLVAPDPLPPRADVLLVLHGSMRGEEARRNEAMRLWKEGRAERVVLSAPQVYFLGEWVPELMRRHLVRVYGEDAAAHVLMCTQSASSTREEALAVLPCLQRNGVRTVVVVTSNYHTRRARHIWRETTAGARPPLEVFVHGVSDGDFEPRGWWSNRRYAKTLAEETTKMLWSYGVE